MFKLLKLLSCTATVGLLVCLLTTGVLAEANKVGTVAADCLNVRETSSTSAAVISQLYADDQVTILETSDGWYKISYGDTTGWVKADYITVGEGSAATITGDSVNLRSEGSTSSAVITALNYGDKVTVISQTGDWYNVKLADETTGWVYKDYVEIGSVSRGDSLGRKIVSYAQKFMGVRYVYGGNTSSGFDCSGFVKCVYSNFGITLERVAASQAAQGTKVSKASLHAGDLVFFDTDGGKNYINHVGIYLGNGQFIHASSGAGKVVTSTLSDGFYSNCYMTGKTFTR